MTSAEISALIDNKLASNKRIPISDHRIVEHALLDYISANLPKSGDIKPVFCNGAYITANFDGTGLGTNLRLGEALCNGANGTPNLVGKTIIHYSADFTLGQSYGEKTHALTAAEMPSHTHTVGYDLHNASGGGSEATLDINGGSVSGTKTTSSAGSGTAHNNMQPSLALIYVMKL